MTQASFKFMDRGPSKKQRPRRVLTLAQARKGVFNHLLTLKRQTGKGSSLVCPCCDQTVKLYTRPLNYEKSAWLGALVDAYEQDPRWIHNREVRARGGDYAKLRFFGLIKRHPDKAGFWMPTRLGIDFVKGKCEAPAFVLVYNNECWAVSSETVSFEEAQTRKEKVTNESA